MPLPININSLLEGDVVENERIEYKEGWNKEDILHTMTAFANDFHNWGGGYIVVGIREKDGMPVLPPKGIALNKIDKINQELVSVSNLIAPPYTPQSEVVEYMGKHILVIWAFASDMRPHKARVKLGGKSVSKDSAYYIRKFASTTVASQAQEIELLETASRTPFDDRVNHDAELIDLDPVLIKRHLKTVGSQLAEQVDKIPFEELCIKMNIVHGPTEYLKPRNIGLLMFSNEPEKFFPEAKIILGQFRDDTGDAFTEKHFTGPIQTQLQDALAYLKNNIIAQRVTKQAGVAESDRVNNYPFSAVEEALANAVYHRGYNEGSPAEVRVFPDRIEILSYPGPLPPIDKIRMQQGKFTARKYRNRRIGDFLKELHLTESMGTGIPKIKSSLLKNGSPKAEFETDDDRTFFQVTLPVHPAWLGAGESTVGGSWVQDRVQVGVQDSNDVEKKILVFCKRPKKSTEILETLGLYPNYKQYEKLIKPLVEKGYLEQTIPEKPTSRYQQYRTSADGEASLKEGSGSYTQTNLQV